MGGSVICRPVVLERRMSWCVAGSCFDVSVTISCNVETCESFAEEAGRGRNPMYWRRFLLTRPLLEECRVCLALLFVGATNVMPKVCLKGGIGELSEYSSVVGQSAGESDWEWNGSALVFLWWILRCAYMSILSVVLIWFDTVSWEQYHDACDAF